MLQTFLDVFFPRRSAHEPVGYWLTEADWESIRLAPYTEDVPSLVARGVGSLDSVTSAMRYDSSHLLQRAIHVLKYRKLPGLAHKLAMFIVRTVATELTPGVVLVPIPLHWSRLLERGFNQAERLTLHIAKVTELPMKKLLRRTRDTGHQAWRSRVERLEAMEQAFKYIGRGKPPYHVILIDDIVTTGATLDACARVLKAAGVKRVDAWVIARS